MVFSFFSELCWVSTGVTSSRNVPSDGGASEYEGGCSFERVTAFALGVAGGESPVSGALGPFLTFSLVGVARFPRVVCGEAIAFEMAGGHEAQNQTTGPRTDQLDFFSSRSYS